MHLQCMLCRKFELFTIKIGFFYEFLKLLQNWAKVPVVQGLGPNFAKNENEKILHFYYIFLIHIHVLMLCRKFELILIKIGFFYEFLKLLKNLVKVPVL